MTYFIFQVGGKSMSFYISFAFAIDLELICIKGSCSHYIVNDIYCWIKEQHRPRNLRTDKDYTQKRTMSFESKSLLLFTRHTQLFNIVLENSKLFLKNSFHVRNESTSWMLVHVLHVSIYFPLKMSFRLRFTCSCCCFNIFNTWKKV